MATLYLLSEVSFFEYSMRPRTPTKSVIKYNKNKLRINHI